MRLRDWILLGLLFLWFAGAVLMWIRKKKNGTCPDCSGCSKGNCDFCKQKR